MVLDIKASSAAVANSLLAMDISELSKLTTFIRSYTLYIYGFGSKPIVVPISTASGLSVPGNTSGRGIEYVAAENLPRNTIGH